MAKKPKRSKLKAFAISIIVVFGLLIAAQSISAYYSNRTIVVDGMRKLKSYNNDDPGCLAQSPDCGYCPGEYRNNGTECWVDESNGWNKAYE